MTWRFTALSHSENANLRSTAACAPSFLDTAVSSFFTIDLILLFIAVFLSSLLFALRAAFSAEVCRPVLSFAIVSASRVIGFNLIILLILPVKVNDGNAGQMFLK
jgi:hypothetical protein